MSHDKLSDLTSQLYNIIILQELRFERIFSLQGIPLDRQMKIMMMFWNLTGKLLHNDNKHLEFVKPRTTSHLKGLIIKPSHPVSFGCSIFLEYLSFLSDTSILQKSYGRQQSAYMAPKCRYSMVKFTYYTLPYLDGNGFFI